MGHAGTPYEVLFLHGGCGWDDGIELARKSGILGMIDHPWNTRALASWILVQPVDVEFIPGRLWPWFASPYVWAPVWSLLACILPGVCLRWESAPTVGIVDCGKQR